MLKRAHDGTFHKMSPKHLQRYVSEFAGKHSIRNSGTLAQMRGTTAVLDGPRILHWDLYQYGKDKTHANEPHWRKHILGVIGTVTLYSVVGKTQKEDDMTDKILSRAPTTPHRLT